MAQGKGGMIPEEHGVSGDRPNVQTIRPLRPGVGSTDAEALRLQIRQTRSELGGTIDDIERRIDVERLAARAEAVADHVVREATERAKQVVLEATNHAKSAATEAALEITDHAKEAAKEITDHALGETKLAVREMTGQAKAAAREATIGKVENMVQNASQRASGAGSGVVELITRNPVAAALTGLGLGWLLLGNRSSSVRPAASGPYYSGQAYYPSSRAEWQSGSYQPAGEQGPNLSEKVGEKFGEAQDAARGALDQARDTAGEMAGQAQVMAQGVGGTATDLGSAVLETIQQNPLPAALAAASLGFLILNRPGAGTPVPLQESRYQAERAVGGLKDSTGQLADRVQDTAGEMVGRVQQTTDRMASQAQDTFDDFGSSVQAQALRTQYRLEQFFSDHPLLVGAAALALGAMVSLPVPQTQQEHQLMGQASGNLINRAQSVAQETAQKLQQVAAGQQGPDDDLRQQARDVAKDAGEVARKLAS